MIDFSNYNEYDEYPNDSFDDESIGDIEDGENDISLLYSDDTEEDAYDDTFDWFTNNQLKTNEPVKYLSVHYYVKIYTKQDISINTVCV